MECMYCHKQHELNSLRAKLHRFENGKEFKDLSDSLDKMKSRAEFLQQMSQANREKRIHAEEEAKVEEVEIVEEPVVEEVKEEEYNPTGEIKKVTCPECGNTIEMAEGCFICLNCGYSGCS